MELKWGIIGLGNISKKFANDLRLVDQNSLAAVASRSIDKAKSFASEYNAKKFYNSYLDLYQDVEVDIVYIGTPHNLHFEQSIQAMQKGKHVLCEKPLALNEAQVIKMIETARENEVFLMEAMWSRFNPSIVSIKEKIDAGMIGQVNYIQADFSFYRDVPAQHRMLNMDLAGGALLDVGVYPLFLNYLILGIPDNIQATSIKHDTGADLQTSIVLRYPNALNNIICGFNAASSMIGSICGTKGRILIDANWHETDGYQIEYGSDISKIDLPRIGKGLSHEIIECYDCIGQGLKQSSKWSHQNSLDLVRMTDEIRKQINLTYSQES